MADSAPVIQEARYYNDFTLLADGDQQSCQRQGADSGEKSAQAGTTRCISQLDICALQPDEDPSYRRTTFQI